MWRMAALPTMNSTLCAYMPLRTAVRLPQTERLLVAAGLDPPIINCHYRSLSVLT
jgi:hypothetical protein